MAQVTGATILHLDGAICAAWSDASRGDLRPSGQGPGDGDPLTRLAADVARSTGSTLERVAWLTQMHGTDVRTVPSDAPSTAGLESCHLGAGDASVSAMPGVALCVLTADCAPVALASPEGVYAAVHAGWRGLLDGVVEQTVEHMRRSGATAVTAALGPCIHPCCYEFADDALDRIADVYGDGVRATTAGGRPALDLPAGVSAAVAAAGARTVGGVDACTACGGGRYSHRARADVGRQALLVWSTAPGGPR